MKYLYYIIVQPQPLSLWRWILTFEQLISQVQQCQVQQASIYSSASLLPIKLELLLLPHNRLEAPKHHISLRYANEFQPLPFRKVKLAICVKTDQLNYRKWNSFSAVGMQNTERDFPTYLDNVTIKKPLTIPNKFNHNIISLMFHRNLPKCFRNEFLDGLITLHNKSQCWKLTWTITDDILIPKYIGEIIPRTCRNYGI